MGRRDVYSFDGVEGIGLINSCRLSAWKNLAASVVDEEGDKAEEIHVEDRSVDGG